MGLIDFVDRHPFVAGVLIGSVPWIFQIGAYIARVMAAGDHSSLPLPDESNYQLFAGESGCIRGYADTNRMIPVDAASFVPFSPQENTEMGRILGQEPEQMAARNSLVERILARTGLQRCFPASG